MFKFTEQFKAMLLDNLKNRLDLNNDSDNYLYYSPQDECLTNMQVRLKSRGGTDQWTRMREDKLKGLKKALLSSYQSAVVQKYNVENETLIKDLHTIIAVLENKEELTDIQKTLLDELEQKYTFLAPSRDSETYIYDLINIIEQLTLAEPMFRCLINHDKLKVDYEDKIISIPFEQPPIGNMDAVETNFHNGTVFKWIAGNKEEWTPDTYWIVYMQYSEETAYFRAEIRKADEEIEIITIDEQGKESSATYRGWMTGPNETEVQWNIKKGIVWNDMNYTKLLYITRDENTLAFFQRFDRIIINGYPWEVQAYNEAYSKGAAGTNSGIIRVALKETYTSTNEFIKQTLENIEQAKAAQDQYDAEHTETRIDGPTVVEPYGIITYTAKNFDDGERDWILSDTPLAKIKNISEDKKTVTIEILTGKSNKTGFDLNYGDAEQTKLHIIIGSF